MSKKLTTRPMKEVYFKFRDREERVNRLLDVVRDYADSDDAILFDDVLAYIGVSEAVIRKYIKQLKPPVKMSCGNDAAGKMWVVFDSMVEVKNE